MTEGHAGVPGAPNDDGPATSAPDGRQPPPGTAIPSDPGPGRVLAALLVVALAFGAGLLVGQSRPGGGTSASPSATTAAHASHTLAITPTASPSPDPTATPSASPSEAPPTTATPAPPTAAPTPTPAPTATPGTAAATVPPAAPDEIGLLWEALQLIRERYVGRGALDDTELTYGALSGLVEALGDTGHSVFLTPEDLAAEREALRGRLVGIGALLGEQGGRPVIISVVPDAPADRAGVRAGDLILAVDGTPVERLSSERISRMVRGEEGTEVTLTVLHRGEDVPLDISMVRERIEIQPASWAMVPGTRIADVRLIQFSEGAAEAVKTALQEALAAGAEAVILDLRSNPGGLVQEAVGVASQFLAEGTVYIRQDAQEQRTPVQAEAGGLATEVPLVVLVDLGTASSAEIVAGAIKSNERGIVVGTRTFGTGTVLNTFELSDGSAVRLGVERWLTPKGELIFEHGIEPGEVVELGTDSRPLEPGEVGELTPEELAEAGDTQLLRAMELLGGG